MVLIIYYNYIDPLFKKAKPYTKYLVILTGKGLDFLAICPDEKSTFVDVKIGYGSFTKLQRKTKYNVKENGLKYNVEPSAYSRSDS